MQITNKLLDTLTAEGITFDTHHATVKSTVANLTGDKLSAADYKELRQALKTYQSENAAANGEQGVEEGSTTDTTTTEGEDMAKNATQARRGKKATAKKATAEAPKRERKAPEPLSEKDAAKKASSIIKERAGDPDMPGWANVVKATEISSQGVPQRVVIRCADPQEGADCDKTREIAAQDVFQVQRCVPCQKRFTQNYRNALAKRRRQANGGGAVKAKAGRKATKAGAKKGRKASKR